MVQLVPRPIFNSDNESGHKIALFILEHLLYPKQRWEHHERLGNILQMEWFELYMDLFLKGESRSEEGNLKFPPDHTVWLF